MKIICPNCGYKANYNYCAKCGQATHIHQETLWAMITHFLAHYFHYDSKLWLTLKALITRPGKLTAAYRENIRQRYIPPISLYIVVSVFFFLLFSFTVKFEQHTVIKPYPGWAGHQKAEINYYYSFGRAGFEGIEKNTHTDKWIVDNDCDSMKTIKQELKNWDDERGIFFKDAYNRKMAKAALHLQPDAIALVMINYFIMPYMYRHQIYSWDEGVSITIEKFLHVVPKIFFVLMPLFAALLFLIFFSRKEKKYLFTDHAVMSLHIHVFLFLSVGLQLILGSIVNTAFTIYKDVIWFWMVIPGIYFLLACRNFYKRSWGYTIIAGTITWLIYLFIVLIASVSAWLLMIHFG